MTDLRATADEEGQPRLRADARRNRERLLLAASAAFAEEGFDVGVAEIARRAGVGTGTFFRHFPTKRDLEVEVVLQRSAGLREAVADALAEPDPWTACAGLMTRVVEMAACDRCLGQASKPELADDPRIERFRMELLDGIERVLERGRAAGVVRRDIAAADMPVLTSAIATTVERFGRTQPDLWRRYLGVVLDGIRAEGAAPLAPGPPSATDVHRPATSGPSAPM